ncbi:unnamed protein product [Danaus chrysippus]|uniref:(African queen) hypothetical protein n=1 Tax=Danaus chrysippus TaxID=151541 RepID=A0A8J2W9X0_9NEOP|nr:unnamed protein product [Danaus chrysippus]
MTRTFTSHTDESIDLWCISQSVALTQQPCAAPVWYESLGLHSRLRCQAASTTLRHRFVAATLHHYRDIFHPLTSALLASVHS